MNSKQSEIFDSIFDKAFSLVSDLYRVHRVSQNSIFNHDSRHSDCSSIDM